MGPAKRLAGGSQGACLRTSGQAFAWGRCECRGVLVGVTDGDGEWSNNLMLERIVGRERWKMCQNLEEGEFLVILFNESEMRGFLNSFELFKGIRSLADCNSIWVGIYLAYFSLDMSAAGCKH